MKNRQLSKGQLWILFAVYLILLLKVIVFKKPLSEMKWIINSWSPEVIKQGIEHANLQPFRTIDMYVRYWNRGLGSFENLVGNVIAFLPMGYLLPRICRWAGNLFVCVGLGAVAVLGIEIFQLVSSFGAFDVDDIILNLTGILIGYIIFLLVMKNWKRKRDDYDKRAVH